MSLNTSLVDYCSLMSLITSLDAPGKGGNISVKYEDLILIKSSGQNMKQKHLVSICDSNGISKFGYDFVSEKHVRDSKPSMEIQMHLNLKSKYVFHYHPIYVLPYLCSDYEFSFGETIDYINPGTDLAEAVLETSNEILWLKNHGIVIHSDSLTKIAELYYYIKQVFFEAKNIPYTPDDVVDPCNPELWLVRQYTELMAEKLGLSLYNISSYDREKLLDDPNEQYRMNGVK